MVIKQNEIETELLVDVIARALHQNSLSTVIWEELVNHEDDDRGRLNPWKYKSDYRSDASIVLRAIVEYLPVNSEKEFHSREDYRFANHMLYESFVGLFSDIAPKIATQPVYTPDLFNWAIDTYTGLVVKEMSGFDVLHVISEYMKQEQPKNQHK